MWDNYVPDDFVGLIVLSESKGYWANQTGGYSCHQRITRGTLMPMPDPLSLQEALDRFFVDGPKWRGWCNDGIDVDTADFLDQLLAGIVSEIGLLTVNRARLTESEEAWVYVKSPESDAVLVWENSD
jgi:hypothetical protein